MKVTYNEILAANRALQALQQSSAAVVAPLAALRLARAAKVIGQEAEIFEAGRVALIKQHVSEPAAQGNQTVPSEKLVEFTQELTELAKQEIEVNVQMLSLEDFGNCQLRLTALIGMEWLFVDTNSDGEPV